MKTWDEFIIEKILMDSDIVQMISEFEQYQIDAFIGDCLIRRTAMQWAENLGCYVSVTSTMRDISVECYKILAHRWIEANKL